jgi:hypothetical protein
VLLPSLLLSTLPGSVSEAITCTERSGDHLINSILHGRAGAAALALGNIAAAPAHLDAAARAAQQIGWESTNVPRVMGLVPREARDLEGARSAFEDALRISRRNGLNIGIAGAIAGLACLAGGVRATGTGQPHSTASRKPFRTGPAIRGTNPTRVTGETAWTKRGRTWAMSSWSGPTTRAWRSARRRRSTWLS